MSQVKKLQTGGKISADFTNTIDLGNQYKITKDKNGRLLLNNDVNKEVTFDGGDVKVGGQSDSYLKSLALNKNSNTDEITKQGSTLSFLDDNTKWVTIDGIDVPVTEELKVNLRKTISPNNTRSSQELGLFLDNLGGAVKEIRHGEFIIDPNDSGAEQFTNQSLLSKRGKGGVRTFKKRGNAAIRDTLHHLSDTVSSEVSPQKQVFDWSADIKAVTDPYFGESGSLYNPNYYNEPTVDGKRLLTQEGVDAFKKTFDHLMNQPTKQIYDLSQYQMDIPKAPVNNGIPNWTGYLSSLKDKFSSGADINSLNADMSNLRRIGLWDFDISRVNLTPEQLQQLKVNAAETVAKADSARADAEESVKIEADSQLELEKKSFFEKLGKNLMDVFANAHGNYDNNLGILNTSDDGIPFLKSKTGKVLFYTPGGNWATGYSYNPGKRNVTWTYPTKHDHVDFLNSDEWSEDVANNLGKLLGYYDYSKEGSQLFTPFESTIRFKNNPDSYVGFQYHKNAAESKKLESDMNNATPIDKISNIQINDSSEGKTYKVGDKYYKVYNGRIYHLTKATESGGVAALPIETTNSSGNIQHKYILANKQGGIIKAQFGSTIVNLDSKNKSKDEVVNSDNVVPGAIRKGYFTNLDYEYKINKTGGFDDLTTDDYAQLGAATADLASIGALAIPGAGNVVSAGLGATSTLTNYGINVKNEGVNIGNTANMVGNLALDALTLIPGVGAIPKTVKAVKVISTIKKPLIKLLKAATPVMLVSAGITNSWQLIKNLDDPNHKFGMSEITSIVKLMSNAARAKSLLDVRKIYSGDSEKGVLKLQLKGDKNAYTAEELQKIKVNAGELRSLKLQRSKLSEGDPKITEIDDKLKFLEENIKKLPEEIQSGINIAYKSIIPEGTSFKGASNVKGLSSEDVSKTNSAFWRSNQEFNVINPTLPKKLIKDVVVLNPKGSARLPKVTLKDLRMKVQNKDTKLSEISNILTDKSIKTPKNKIDKINDVISNEQGGVIKALKKAGFNSIGQHRLQNVKNNTPVVQQTTLPSIPVTNSIPTNTQTKKSPISIYTANQSNIGDTMLIGAKSVIPSVISGLVNAGNLNRSLRNQKAVLDRINSYEAPKLGYSQDGTQNYFDKNLLRDQQVINNLYNQGSITNSSNSLANRVMSLEAAKAVSKYNSDVNNKFAEHVLNTDAANRQIFDKNAAVRTEVMNKNLGLAKETELSKLNAITAINQQFAEDKNKFALVAGEYGKQALEPLINNIMQDRSQKLSGDLNTELDKKFNALKALIENADLTDDEIKAKALADLKNDRSYSNILNTVSKYNSLSTPSTATISKKSGGTIEEKTYMLKEKENLRINRENRKWLLKILNLK